MIVDASALIAILTREPERDEFVGLLAQGSVRISAATWFEAAMVADGRGPQVGALFDELVRDAEIEVVPLTLDQVRAARTAWRRYGRGSGSPARLNFGDCFSYALSATSGEGLLFEGDDFSHTDVLNARQGH